MKMTLKATALAMIVALPTQALAEKFKRVTKEADYVRLVVGKKVGTDANTWFRSNADGSFDGMANGKAVRGAWQWSGRFWCRNAVIDGKEIGTDCQVVKVSDSGVENTRNKGKGKTVFNAFMN